MAFDDTQRSYDPPELWPPSGRRNPGGSRLGYVVLLLGAALLAAVIGVLYLPGGKKPEGPVFPQQPAEIPLEQVSDLAFPATLISRLALAGGGADGIPAAMPADVALADGRTFLLDTNDGQVLELGESGGGHALPAAASGDGPALVLPMAMAEHDGRLYIANSGAGNIVVMDPEGNMERQITPKVTGAKPLRPVGIAVAGDGQIFLSDPDNHRVLHLDGDGKLLSVLGSGQRESGDYGFNAPGGLALDGQGNLYVVDMLNYAVKKYSPSGEFLMAVGQAGDTEGSFSRPKGVAVDGAGRIYTSDGLLLAIQVFGPDGQYLGFIGRSDPGDKTAQSLFEAPHGLKVAGDTLYVVDRFAGVFAFRLP